jgi:hypothetical protein
LAIRIPQIESAYRLYIDAELMSLGGLVAAIESAGIPGYDSAIVRIPNGFKAFSISIQVSNYHSSWGGLWAPIVLGDIDSLYTMERDNVALSLFMPAFISTRVYG